MGKLVIPPPSPKENPPSGFCRARNISNQQRGIFHEGIYHQLAKQAIIVDHLMIDYSLLWYLLLFFVERKRSFDF